MPVSKKRKSVKQKSPRSNVVAARERSSVWRSKLNGSRLHFLKQNPDFLATIKMGRVTNTIAFAVQTIKENMAERTPAEKRQSRRALFVLGGYLHEGLAVVKSIQGRYLGIPEYEPLRFLVHDPRHKRTRSYIKIIRNYAAFHLDDSDATTSDALANMKLTWYDFVSGDAKDPLTVYFEFADVIDMEFLIAKFGDEENRNAAPVQITISILDFATIFVDALSKFLQYLMQKTAIHEHLQGTYLPKSEGE